MVEPKSIGTSDCKGTSTGSAKGCECVQIVYEKFNRVEDRETARKEEDNMPTNYDE